MKSISLSHLFGAALVAQILCLQPLWEHESSSNTFLGRYSTAYGLALLLSIGLLIMWLVLCLRHRRAEAYLRRLPDQWRYIIILGSGLLVLGLWLYSIEAILQNYLAVNWLFVTLIFLWTQPDKLVQTQRWRWILVGALVLIALPMAVTVLTARPFSPDEAQWADMSTNYFVNGGVYPRTWLEPPYVIKPGIGWSVAAYGWALEHIAFTYRTGRIWNMASFILAYLGIGLVTSRLYGRQAAFASVVFALLSHSFLVRLDYRPDHQLPALSMLMLFAALQGRRGHRPGFWHCAVGLLATLGMQLHAGSIFYAFGFSLYYMLEALWKGYRQRRWQVFEPVIWFGLGAAAGTGIYYWFNIQSVGGLDTYLSTLIADRWTPERELAFLYWPHLFESILIWSGLAYILWRRSQSDRLFIGMLVCQLISIALLNTEGGYYTTFNAWYMIPIGTLLVDGLRTPSLPAGQNRRSIYAQVAAAGVMIGLVATLIVDWNGVRQFLRTGQIPPSIIEQVGQAVRPYTGPDDIIISTHELLWEFHQPTDQLISVAAEIPGTRRWGLDSPIELWRQIQPTVIIFVEARMTIPESLQTYMDENGFQICERLNPARVNVTIYRVECP